MRQEACDSEEDGHHGTLWVDLGLKNNGAVYSNRQVTSESRW